ncbi:MAG: cobalt-precorrin 5A hydrolase [Firmicutes bacterium]|nr:cobalt-precorrin 5A hydrolase [Bacillota bacterium]
MKWAVITLTKGALIKAKEIKKKLPTIDIYTLSKLNDKTVKSINGSLKEFVGRIFFKYDTLIFIMATGIVVRVIGEYLESKTKDPAILVMDEKGDFVISLLSGHLGKANEKALFLSDKINATPVITTASDVKKTIAVDTLAMKLNCLIDDMTKAKDITSLIVNEEPVGLISDIKVNTKLAKNIYLDKFNKKDVLGIIYITNKNKMIEYKNYVKLIPKNIVVGIGCKKGKKSKDIIKAIYMALEKLNLNKKAIKSITTVDVKINEIGIIKAARYFNAELKIIDREKIKKIENKFKTSEFVKKSIGVGAVCEPCGFITSNKGKCLLEKKAYDGITLSVWEENSNE